MKCTFRIGRGRYLHCRRCDHLQRVPDGKDVELWRRALRRNCTPPAGLGDWLAMKLARVGLTKRRWSRFVRRRSIVCGGGATAVLVPHIGKGCGCAKRQAALNRWFPFGPRTAPPAST